jgi:hypothetical protein
MDVPTMSSIFPVPFRVPGHFGDGSGFVEGDTGLVQVRDDHFCPANPSAPTTQLPGTKDWEQGDQTSLRKNRSKWSPTHSWSKCICTYVHNLNRGKSRKIGNLFTIQFKVSNRPLGENLPNLVTLIKRQSIDAKLFCRLPNGSWQQLEILRNNVCRASCNLLKMKVTKTSF